MTLAADEALQRLRDGNRRFAAGHSEHRVAGEALRSQLADGQSPFAVILGCSDSRVPAEIVFDQGLGDLFVVRVAGNIAQPSQIGSVEFACSAFGTRLVIVLGHSSCGAIEATLRAIAAPEEIESRNIGSIVDLIRPSIESLLEDSDTIDRDILLERAVRNNVRASVDRLRSESGIIRDLERDDGLRIVGAEYALDSGRVEFFDDPRA